MIFNFVNSSNIHTKGSVWMKACLFPIPWILNYLRCFSSSGSNFLAESRSSTTPRSCSKRRSFSCWSLNESWEIIERNSTCAKLGTILRTIRQFLHLFIRKIFSKTKIFSLITLRPHFKTIKMLQKAIKGIFKTPWFSRRQCTHF